MKFEENVNKTVPTPKAAIADLFGAAGVVVTKDMPDNSLVAGVPAKVIREIENDVE